MSRRSTKSSPNTKTTARTQYPFTAIVGQDEMKLALILNAIDPHISGVLIMGHRGTGKSTAVRGLAELLPHIAIVTDCFYHCDPADIPNLCSECFAQYSKQSKLSKSSVAVSVVELPLGATEDRVCGSIDIQRALSEGTKSFEPGLLARANRGFLYIDEVNLLDDHLVDLLLDVAVTGHNKVERESISVEHAASFVLIGSGNPEEGELRPQLLDRFGLHVEIETENDLDQRVEIVERQTLFEADREAFLARFSGEQEELRQRIVRARKMLPSVSIDRGLMKQIAELSVELKLDGHRGELTMSRAARSLAAFENRRKVTESDVKRVAPMSVRHRLRSEPFDEVGSTERIKRALEKVFGNAVEQRPGDDDFDGNGRRARQNKNEHEPAMLQSDSANGSRDAHAESREQLQTKSPANGCDITSDFVELKTRKRSRNMTARTSRRKFSARLARNSERGKYARAVEVPATARIAFDATLRVLFSSAVLFPEGDQLKLRPSKDALRYKQFSCKRGALYILAIDVSGSMAQRRINRAREVALALLRKAYINRDNVAIVAFREDRADVLLAPSRSMLRAKRTLGSLAVGGSTPLSAGVLCAFELARSTRARYGEPAVILFTDGNANVPLHVSEGSRAQRKLQIQNELQQLGAQMKRDSVDLFVVKTEDGFNSSRNAKTVAKQLNAPLIHLRFIRLVH